MGSQHPIHNCHHDTGMMLVVPRTVIEMVAGVVLMKEMASSEETLKTRIKNDISP